jgi:acetyl esterase/lipase
MWSIAAMCGGVGAGEVRVVKDIHYKPDASTEYEQQRCKLDLYLPAGAKDFPTIVWFHGGGLKGGDKTGDATVKAAQRLAADGIAVASVNYRLNPQAQFPAYIEDAAAAVAFIHREITGHGGSATRVFVSGHSAGGYLTAMVGLAPTYLAKHGMKPTQLAGLIPISGQMVTHATVRGERGVPPTQPVIDDAAPSWHVTADAPPILAIAGGEDLPARAEENRYFVAALKAAGHPNATYAEFAGRNHGTVANRMHEPSDEVAKIVKDMVLGVK